MTAVVLTLILFVLGFAVLIKGGDLLVDGASALAKRYRVSDLVIGLTVVAFGTSAPELFVNVIASFQGKTGIAIGNAVGSSIANIFLILGIASLIYPLTVTRGTVRRDIPLSLLSSLVLSVLANDRLLDGMAYNALLRTDGMIFLAFFIIFLYYSFTIGPGPAMTVKEKAALPRLPVAVVQVFAGLAGLVLGGKWIVDGAVFIAVKLGMSESLVGLSIVAVGTSLPELATSAIAAYKKNVEIAVGNVVGSNIFNIFFVLGVSSVIKPLPFNTSANIDIGVLMLANILLFISMFTGARRIIDRWEGGVFLGLYAGYIAWRAAMG